MQAFVAGALIILSAFQESADERVARETASLGLKGYALFGCAALAGEFAAAPNKTEDYGARGFAAFKEYYARISVPNPSPALRKAIDSTVPFLVALHLRGPTPDFAVGRVYEAIVLQTEDDLYGRDGWLHQMKDKSQPPAEFDVIKQRAATVYQERNCELL